MRILILGEISIKKMLFEKYFNFDLTFLNFEEFKYITTNNYDKIIILSNNFDSDIIQKIRDEYNNIPIIIYDINLKSIEEVIQFDIGDYFFINNKIDYNAFKYRYGEKYTSLSTDLLYFNLNDDQNMKTDILEIRFFLNKIDKPIINLIKDLSKKYYIYLDEIDDLKDQLKEYEFDNSCKQRIFYTCKSFHCDLNIVSDQEDITQSIMANIPFICINEKLKLDRYKSKFDTNTIANFDTNTIFIENIESFTLTFNYILENYVQIKTELQKYKESEIDLLQTSYTNLINLCNQEFLLKRKSSPQYISVKDKDQLIQNVIDVIVTKLNSRKSKYYTTCIYNGYTLNKFINKITNKNSIVIQIIEEILWIITGDPHAPYYYGLLENILSMPLLPQISWIIDDYYLNYKYNHDESNFTLINKNFQELHRSGWQYIIDNLILEINTTTKLTIDTYIDKTFHWNNIFYKSKDIIPYKTQWIGFIHHTFSDYNNKYNCERLFNDDIFIESLKTCKCLIVMTEYLKKQILDKIKMLNIDYVRVEVVYHPTEITYEKFTWDKFILNESRSVIQIGNWLRNVFAIYNLELPNTSIIKHKRVLRNKNTENYFLPPDFFDNFKKLDTDGSNDVLDMCKMSFQNMHVKSIYNTILNYENSVEEIGYLQNNDYDKLLSQNIVFINLIDASAINTLLECILRNTPILINPIEPVVEILGVDYPLYYSNLYEASCLLNNTNIIKDGYNYLLKVDKTRFYIDTFINKISDLLKDLSG